MKPHHTHTPLPLLALLTALALAAPARAIIIDPFIRAGVDFTKLNAIENLRSDQSWKEKLNGWNTGYFGEAGLKILGSHTLAIEAGYVNATATIADTAAGIQSREQIPILLNYRNSFNLGPLSIFLGLSAGMMSDKAKWREDVGSATADWKTFKSANWVALYGATAGLGLNLGAHWAIDLGVRALGVSAKQYQDGNLPNSQDYTIGKSKVYIRPNLRLALSLRW